MYTMAFEFNGIKSSDIGVYILNFDGFSNNGTVSGSHYTFNTSKPSNSVKLNFHGSKSETQLERTWQIGKLDCNNNIDYEFTREEFAFLQCWLERTDGYRYLRFLQEGYEDTYFNCQLSVDPYYSPTGKLVGAELKMSCDAPYGYSDIRTFEVECNDGDSFQIYNDSDKIGAIIFDQVDIVTTSNISNLQITNDMESKYNLQPHITSIKNCISGEHISISDSQIGSSNNTTHENKSVVNDFNFNYLRLINLSDSNANGYTENRINTYTVKGGSCRLSFSYRVIRSVMP